MGLQTTFRDPEPTCHQMEAHPTDVCKECLSIE